MRRSLVRGAVVVWGATLACTAGEKDPPQAEARPAVSSSPEEPEPTPDPKPEPAPPDDIPARPPLAGTTVLDVRGCTLTMRGGWVAESDAKWDEVWKAAGPLFNETLDPEADETAGARLLDLFHAMIRKAAGRAKVERFVLADEQGVVWAIEGLGRKRALEIVETDVAKALDLGTVCSLPEAEHQLSLEDAGWACGAVEYDALDRKIVHEAACSSIETLRLPHGRSFDVLVLLRGCYDADVVSFGLMDELPSCVPAYDQ